MPRPKNVKNGQLGEAIRTKRLELGFTLRDLAKKCLKPNGEALSQQYIYDIENNTRTPSSDTVEKIALALELEPAYLQALAGHPPTILVTYLETYPEAAPAAMRIFARALRIGFTNWDAVSFPENLSLAGGSR